MEFGRVPPYSDDIASAMKGNRIFVDVRSSDGETVLMEFGRMSEGFVMSGIHSKGDRDSSWALDIGMEIEDMLYEGRRYLFPFW